MLRKLPQKEEKKDRNVETVTPENREKEDEQTKETPVRVKRRRKSEDPNESSCGRWKFVITLNGKSIRQYIGFVKRGEQSNFFLRYVSIRMRYSLGAHFFTHPGMFLQQI